MYDLRLASSDLTAVPSVIKARLAFLVESRVDTCCHFVRVVQRTPSNFNPLEPKLF
jgi:hypothetical protein